MLEVCSACFCIASTRREHLYKTTGSRQSVPARATLRKKSYHCRGRGLPNFRQSAGPSQGLCRDRRASGLCLPRQPANRRARMPSLLSRKLSLSISASFSAFLVSV
eukprot:UN1834